jgi:hypothetical protein
MTRLPLNLQVAQQGLTWSALGQSITPDFPFSGRGVFLMVTADIFIYALLTAYLDHVRIQHELLAHCIQGGHAYCPGSPSSASLSCPVYCTKMQAFPVGNPSTLMHCAADSCGVHTLGSDVTTRAQP